MNGFIKIGESITISASNIQPIDNILADNEAVIRLEKMAFELKTIAPKARDFLYFAAVMMHAAEAALLDDSGNLRKDASGNEVNSEWLIDGESWRWKCSDSNLRPYKNANGDIFPEAELLKAYKQWIGKPLCLDHRSDSVDHIRGVIVDTYYDFPKKRVVALCALDKKTYPDLAHKVSSRCTTSVSMGTGVSTAICFDCGKVAKVEADFCDHMRYKTCYGEINTGLKPIELSIVVNGADQKAQIKHVIAAADSISKYVDDKQSLISKLSMHEMVNPETVSDIKKDLQNILEKLDSLETTAKDVEKIEKGEEKGEEPGEYKAAHDTTLKILLSLQERVTKLQDDINQLQKNGEEQNMTTKEAYFQGGGGVNEPTPGKPKYEKEDYQNLRDQVDKQMVGQMDTGPVDGMHPGPDSAGESEEARKKRLQRLASEEKERALKREAAAKKAKEALETNAYFQGGGGANEPTPGKAKYPVENYTKVRDKDDKQMNGQKPFPDVGDIDGLHPSPNSADQKDELKRKQMLARAKLQARFYKAAGPDGQTEDKSKSCWQVFADNKLILTATVDEITNGKTDALYDSVASKDYGQKILGWVRTKDFKEVQAMLKTAQAAPALPEMPLDPGGMPGESDAGGTGDPAEVIPEALDRAENAITDLRSATEALLGDEPSELDEFSEMATPKAAYFNKMKEVQKKVAASIATGMKENIANLTDKVEELQYSKSLMANKSKLKKAEAKLAEELTKEALDETNEHLAESVKLLKSFVTFANGTKELLKQARQEKALVKKAGGPAPGEGMTLEELEMWYPETAKEMRADPLLGIDNKIIPMSEDEQKKEQDAAGTAYVPPAAPKKAPKPSVVEQWAERADGPSESVMFKNEVPAGKVQPKPTAKKPGGGGAGTYEAPGNLPQNADDMNDLKAQKGDLTLDMTTEEAKQVLAKENRVKEREKLAQQGLKFSDMLNKAHPSGGTTPAFDTKPTGDLAKVERIDEQHKTHMDVATAPIKVRQAAEDIQRLVVKGDLKPTDEMFAKLIAEGVDPAAVSYWKQFYGQAKDGGSQFASELVKDYSSKKAAEEMETYRVKIARSYEVANDMARAGLIAGDKATVDSQAKSLMSYNEDAFNSFKRFLATQGVRKNAMVQVGAMMSATDVVLPAPEAKKDDFSELALIFSQTPAKRRVF